MDLIVHTYFTNWQILYISIAYLVKQAQNLCIAEQSWTKFLTKVIKKSSKFQQRLTLLNNVDCTEMNLFVTKYISLARK